MAETRTYEPDDGSDLAKLVRDALGETVRPVEPGAPSSQEAATPTEVADGSDAEQADAELDRDDERPYSSFTADWPSWDSLGGPDANDK